MLNDDEKNYRFTLYKLDRQIRPDQQHRIVIGVGVIKTPAANAAIHPAVILHCHAVAGVAVKLQGIGGIGKIQHAIDGQRQRIVAAAVEADCLDPLDVIAESGQIKIQIGSGEMQDIVPTR